MPANDNGGGIPELVTFTEIARRVTDRGYVARPITRQGVRHIADNDPAWPVPPEQWIRIGNAWAMPWEPIEAFFRDRTTRGRGPARKDDEQQ
jgi:hypothetical protein